MNEKRKKKPTDYPIFGMRMSNHEKEHYTKFAERYNLSLAQLIREGLEVLEKYPQFLETISNPFLDAIQEKMILANKEREDYFQNLEQSLERRLTGLQEEIRTLSAIIEKYALKGKKLTRKELKQARQKDVGSEEVFEE